MNVLAPIDRITIQTAREHFLLLKEKQSRGNFLRYQQILQLFEDFMSAKPRSYRWILEVQSADLTAFCSTWTRCNTAKTHDLRRLNTFLGYCFRANFTSRHLGEDLGRTVRWPCEVAPRTTFTAEELEKVWKALPQFADQFPRVGERISRSTEVFVYLMRYTGLDLATTLTLPKTAVRGNQILSHRTKNGAEVWSAVPEWVIQKLWQAPHESERYFFWNGNSTLASARNQWFRRLRKLLNLAGLPHRTPHNFRHYFAMEHLLSGTRIEEVSRLLGHRNIRVTLRFYAPWIEQRQEQMEKQQRQIWEKDPIHRWMANRRDGMAPDAV